jgi:hypothetical protein
LITLLQAAARAYSYRAVPNASIFSSRELREQIYHGELNELTRKFAAGPSTSRHTIKNWQNRNITINSPFLGVEAKVNPIYKKLRELAAETTTTTTSENNHKKFVRIMNEAFKELNHLKSIYNEHGINSAHVTTNISGLRKLVNNAANTMRKQRAAAANAKAAENAQREKNRAAAKKAAEAEEAAKKAEHAQRAARAPRASKNASRTAELQEVINALPASTAAANAALKAKAAANAAANAARRAAAAAKADKNAKVAAIKKSVGGNKQTKINSIQAEYVALARAANAANAAQKKAASNAEAANAAVKALQARRNRLKGKGPASQSNAEAAARNRAARNRAEANRGAEEAANRAAREASRATAAAEESMRRERARGAGSSSNGQRRPSPPRPAANAAAKAAAANRERKKNLLAEVQKRMNMNARIRDAQIQRNKNASKMTNEQKRIVGQQRLSNQNLRNMLAAMNKEGGLSNKPIYKVTKSLIKLRENAIKQAANKAASNIERNQWNNRLTAVRRGRSNLQTVKNLFQNAFGVTVTPGKRSEVLKLLREYHPDKVPNKNKAKATVLTRIVTNITSKMS